MKQVITQLLSLSILITFFSCNNSPDTAKQETKSTADSSAPSTAANTTTPAALTPFDIMEISHTVKDYAKWRPAFDTDGEHRKAAGMEDIVVGRSTGNPNKILIALKMTDMAKAKVFSADPRLKDVMSKAGVTSKPSIETFRVIRYNPDSKEKQWVIITHKVKDFDAWLKVFDSEGAAQRASEGMVDVALSRGIDDPSVVHIVLDITDMARAKAALNSDAKKQLMTSAGVEGKPLIEFYNTAE